MGRRALAIALLVLAETSVANGGAESEPVDEPRLAVVLSGGGARGFAHVGVLRVLEELRVPVDLVVGTSMGAIVGGLYASGWSPDEIEAEIVAADWGSVLGDSVPRQIRPYRRKQDDVYLVPLKMRLKGGKPYVPPSVVGGQNIGLLLRHLEIEGTGEHRFDRFPIRFRAVATDMVTGGTVVLDRGSLATAMRASMAIPGVFPPVEIDGRALGDGGIASNLPVRVARSLGAGTIVAVDVASPLRSKETLGNLFQRIDQFTSLVVHRNTAEDRAALGPADLVIEPEMADAAADFENAAAIIRQGEAAARAAADRLLPFAVGPEAWEAFQSRHRRRADSERAAHELRIDNASRLDDRVLARRLRIAEGEPLDTRRLGDEILRMFALDAFGTIDYELRDEDRPGVVRVKVPDKPYGRNSLQFGFAFENDFHGDTRFNLAVSHLLHPMNRLDGEWRSVAQIGDNSVLSTEIYQPLDTGLRWFVAPSAMIRNDKLTLYDDTGETTSQVRVRSEEARLGFGRVFRNQGQFQIGAFLARTRGMPRIPSAGPSQFAGGDGGPFASFRMDTFDSFTWPRSGVRADLSYAYGLESFGADVPGARVRVGVAQAYSVGRDVVFGSLEASTGAAAELDLRNAALLGGFLRLSGLASNELLGTKGGLARFLYYRELTRFSLGSLTQRMYAGFSLEAGNAYDPGDPVTWSSLRRSASLFAGADTVLGPAFAGVGWSEGGRTAFYLIIGQRF